MIEIPRDICDDTELLGTAFSLEDLVRNATWLINQYGNLPIGTTNFERGCVDDGLELHVVKALNYVELR